MTFSSRLQGALVAILVVLALFLGVADVRLTHRVEHLEELLARGQKREIPPTAPPEREAPTAVVPTLAPAMSLPAAPPPSATAGPPAGTGPADPSKKGSPPVSFVLSGNRFVLSRPGQLPGLDLTEAQKKAIDEIWRNRDLQAQAPTSELQRVDDQADQAIRQLLTPEQLAKYDSQSALGGLATMVVQQSGGSPPDQKTASGLNPGYLGISGDDAPGGGARVTGISPNTAASTFGLQKDDIILEVNGQPVSDLGSLADKIRETGEGAPAQLKIRRGGTDFYQSAVLGPRPK
jgi:hypothetical protein